MDQQSKQGQGQGHGKRKKDDETAAGGNGASNGHDDFPAELAAPAKAAFEAEKQSVEKGIDAWKKLVASQPDGLGAAARAGARLQEGRALERLHRGDEGGGRQGELGRRPRTRSRSCAR